MDFRGISWVGNVYQKFEAMCLEVEEIIVQDTVKYVENQVQTVGTTVKKFYTDMVQDLVPEPAVDSVEHIPASMFHEYAPVCSFSKKSESMNREAMDVQDETWVIHDQGKSCGSAMKLGVSGPYRRTKFGAKQIFRKDKRPHVGKESSLSTVNIPREHDLHMETVNSSVSPAEVERFIPTEPSHKINGNVNEPDLSVDSIRSQNSETEQSSTANIPAGSDDCTKETGEDALNESDVYEQNTKLIQRLSQRPIEESCILVDRDEVHYVVPLDNKQRKHKSYKMIRDAVYSRMRLGREREYKRLAKEEAESGLECDNDRRNMGLGMKDDQPSGHHMSESDWELL